MYTHEIDAETLAAREITERMREDAEIRFNFGSRWLKLDRISYWRHHDNLGGLPSPKQVEEHMAALSHGRSYNAFDLMTRWLVGEKELKTYVHLYKKGKYLKYDAKERLFRKPEPEDRVLHC